MQQFCKYGSVRGAAGNRRPYRDPNAVHLTSLGVQSNIWFSTSFPFREGNCLHRRLTTRGFVLPLGLVWVARAISMTTSAHQHSNRSGGNGAVSGELSAHRVDRLLEAQPLWRFVVRQGCFPHQFAYRIVRQQ